MIVLVTVYESSVNNENGAIGCGCNFIKESVNVSIDMMAAGRTKTASSEVAACSETTSQLGKMLTDWKCKKKERKAETERTIQRLAGYGNR